MMFGRILFPSFAILLTACLLYYILPRSFLPSIPNRDPTAATCHGRTAERFAYVNLCADELSIFPSLVLFYQLQLRRCQRGDFVLMVPTLLKDELTAWQSVISALGVILFWLPRELFVMDMDGKREQLFPIQFRSDSSFFLRPSKNTMRSGEGDPGSLNHPILRERDARIWDKLRVWQLTQYHKIVLLDNDLLVVRNLDEAFDFPDVSSVALSDSREKIAFYQVKNSMNKPLDGESCLSAKDSECCLDDQVNTEDFSNLSRLEEKIVDVTGLNSGFLVLRPSLCRLRKMIDVLRTMKQRPCCPSQEFLWHYFERLGRYNRLEQSWNLRRLEFLEPPERKATLLAKVKIFHFVEKAKPHKLFLTRGIPFWREKFKEQLSDANQACRTAYASYEELFNDWIVMGLRFVLAFRESLPKKFVGSIG
jgi:hypothetical protein